MKSILTFCALVLSTTLALAADGEKPKKPPGAGEGAKHNPAEAFKKLDSNGDGAVTLDEFKAAPFAKKDPQRAEKGFGMKDKDKDGKLSLEEFSARPPGNPGKPGEEGGKKPGKPEGGGAPKPEANK